MSVRCVCGYLDEDHPGTELRCPHLRAARFRPAPPPLAASALSFARSKVIEQPSLFPAPERTSREPWPDDYPVPRPVHALARQMADRGWRTRLQYSRGHGMHSATARPTTLAHFSAVRLWCEPACGRHMAYAIYREPVSGGGKGWHDLRHAGGSLGNLTELRSWLDGHEHATVG